MVTHILHIHYCLYSLSMLLINTVQLSMLRHMAAKNILIICIIHNKVPSDYIFNLPRRMCMSISLSPQNFPCRGFSTSFYLNGCMYASFGLFIQLSETSGSSLGYGYSRMMSKPKTQTPDSIDDSQVPEGST